ncbi:MAG: carbohydrate porin, partial [Candidatus Omnitrophica bacterium]|nr:carbohydrate porin [Candidatus Omnitrophota bacterium]
MELGYGIFDANSDWEKLGDNLFNIGQVTFKPNLFNLPGNYRIIGWHNNANHIQWSDADKTKEAAYGFGLSFDQKVADGVTLFTRYGWQDPDVYNPDITATDDRNYSLEHSWSAGVQVEGANWGRENDVLGFAVGQIYPSDDYKNSDASLNAKTEGHLEAYYKIHINDHLFISPDFQYIWNPFGKDIDGDKDSVFVAGMRAQLDF